MENHGGNTGHNILKLLIFLTLLTFVLIVWGAVVRSSGSGLGCPDWPLCHGQIIPPFRKDVLIEYFHRLLASVVGITTLVTAVIVWKNRTLRKEWGVWMGVVFALLIFQAVLGGIAVKTELHPHVVATHMGVALIFLAMVFYMGLRFWQPIDRSHFPKTGGYRLSHYTLTILFLQIILGSLVAASNAGLACPDFPTCQGVWLPALQGNVALHFFHRVGALIICVLALALQLGARHLTVVRAIFGLTLLQILLGIGTVFMGLPFWMRVAHNAVAVLLFLALMRSTYELRRYSLT